MDRIAPALLTRAAAILSLGAVLVVPSEVWFYPVHLGPDFAMAVVLYGLLGWTMVALLSVTGRRDAGGWWIGAGIFGLLAEGLVVGELYTALPISILWTPLAWHMLVTVGLCLGALRWAMARGAGATLLLSAAFGLGFGLWNGWMWSVRETETGAMAFDWATVAPFAVQCAVGWVLFAAGHRGWDRLAGRVAALDLRVDLAILLGLATLLWATTWAVAAFPAALVLPCLVGASLLALRGTPAGAPRRMEAVPGRRILLTSALPLLAVAGFAVFTQARIPLEINALAIFTLGPTALWLWGRAMLHGLIHRQPAERRQSKPLERNGD
ncbi:hypothetical protein [Jannaschia marina]|uniref:hypothetical protein n=1 Tax=Jannaschia marina TaxID=2741674 RepID=UPI0015CBCCF2|nr:hypothetical protein [Jannaschia marina]